MGILTLRYPDGQEVHLGDRIRVKRFLRAPFEATISYLTGESPAGPALEQDNEGMATLAVRRPDSTALSWTRPRGASLGRGFELLARGS